MRSCTLNAQQPSAPQGVSREGKLHPPAKGSILVAFVLTESATVIDFAGPWEVFQDAMVQAPGSSADGQVPFRLFTVSDSKEPIRATGGLRIIPDYTFDDAPQPGIVVIGAQAGRSPKMIDWMRRMTKQSEVVMEYLRSKHEVHRTGWWWWSTRSVRCLGCGNLETPVPESEKMPAARIKVTLATLKTRPHACAALMRRP